MNMSGYSGSPSQMDDYYYCPQIVLPGSLPEEYSSLVPIHQYYNILASSGFQPPRFPPPSAVAGKRGGGMSSRHRGNTVSGSGYGQYFSYFPAPPKERRRSTGVKPKADGECDIGYCLIKTPGKKPQRMRAASASVAK